jgi:hypothetical protein
MRKSRIGQRDERMVRFRDSKLGDFGSNQMGHPRSTELSQKSVCRGVVFSGSRLLMELVNGRS